MRLFSSSFATNTTELPSQQPKAKKPVKKEETNNESGSDEDDERPCKGKKQEKKPHKLTSISGGGGQSYAKSALPSIREQQRARAAVEAERDDNAEPAFEYEEDTSFVDDMMEKARQKRQLDGGQKSRPKKRKSASGT